MAIDLKQAFEEFGYLKVQEQRRNDEYYLLRQAVKGNYRWPRDWPRHIPMLTFNVCKPISERFVTYLMGKSFTWNVERPNTLEFRDHAERTEKILRRLLQLSKSELQFDKGARSGSQLGRSVFKVYKQGKVGSEHACFSACQPDYFYGVAAGDDLVSEWSVVYYSYPIDRDEARRQHGDRPYKSEREMTQDQYYNPLREASASDYRLTDRKVPVLEIWTRSEYALVVGGVEIYNGDLPDEYKRKSDGQGYIPFVVIENIRNNGEGRGEADIAQSRELNEHYNRLLSRKFHGISRWLNPTITWEGAPANYAEILAQSLAGGGAIPLRLGARIGLLAHDSPNPHVAEMEASLRAAILEASGMSEIALQGTVQGSINTGPALAAQFQPVLSTIEKKRKEWEYGLRSLFSMLLEVQESIGDSKVLGDAVINESMLGQGTADYSDGELVTLTGKDINGLREVTISWPGVLPKDDIESSRLEMEKASQGFQSIYTTLEKLGEEYPADEIARIRMENQDPALRGEKVAEQMRSQAPLMKAQTDQMKTQSDMAMAQQDAQQAADQPPPGEDPNSIGARLRDLARRRPQLDTGDGASPSIGYPDQAA